MENCYNCKLRWFTYVTTALMNFVSSYLPFLLRLLSIGLLARTSLLLRNMELTLMTIITPQVTRKIVHAMNVM